MSAERMNPVSGVEVRQGRPQIMFDGKPLSPATYCDPAICTDDNRITADPDWWLRRYADFHKSGVHNYHVIPVWGKDGTSRFWKGDGVYPTPSPDDGSTCIDWQARVLLEMNPEARIICRFGDKFPSGWFDPNPDHRQTTTDGDFDYPQASLASDKALDGLCEFYRRFVEYCEAQPWANRIFGYLSYPHGEGTTMLNNAGFLFDESPVTQEKFRAYVRDKYADEAALREAWGEPGATFDSVRVPTDAGWRERRKNVMHWIEGNQLRKERDYLDLHRELWIHWYKRSVATVREGLGGKQRFFGLDIGKTPMIGWQINLSFSGKPPGAEFINTLYGSGNIDVAELLDDPGLDAICTPADYTARTVGYGFEPEGLTQSLVIRGKTMICENDCRTYVGTGYDPYPEDDSQGAFRDNAEVRAGMLRNSLSSLTRGHIDNWMIAGATYYDHPEVQEHGIQPVTRLWDASVNWPHVETEHAIAFVVDDTSPRHEDITSGYQNLACIWQRVLGLSNCGIPYRFYLWSDLAHEKMPDHRCYLFPNLFEMNEERMDLLKRKVLRDGRMAIFGPATGITDGTTLGAEWATKLLGVEMELMPVEPVRHVIVGGTDPIVRALPASTKYGDSLPYGPLLEPARGAVEKAGAVTLGMATTYWMQNREGLFLNETDDYKVAWSVAMPLPSNLLRELARRGGCHVWCEEDDVVLASETLAAVHSVKPGPRTLKLPSRRMVWDLLSGKPLGETDTIDMDITPPETRAFYFGEEDPFPNA